MKIIVSYNSEIWAKTLISTCFLVLLLLGGLGCSNPLEEMKEIFNLRFFPSEIEIEEGKEKIVAIWVDQADGLIAVRFTISYNPSIIEVVKVYTSGMGFMFSDVDAEVIEIEQSIDNEKGIAVIGIGAQEDGFRGVDGSGSLAEIVFKARKIGESSLSFVDEEPNDVMTIVYSSKTESGWREMEVETFNSTVTVFELVKNILTMAVEPPEGGTTSPTIGEYEFKADEIVDIIATPSEGYEFTGWTGEVADPDTTSTTVTMDSDKTVTANFEKITEPME